MLTWSYGGGVQSVAIGCLIRAGRLPVPDLAAICDTGREVQSTWDYLRQHMQPHLDTIGLTVQVVPHSFARVDLYDKTGLTLMPAYTDEGRLASFCSGEWKRDAMERWLRVQGVKECTQWIGYSIDEARRVGKTDHRPWCHNEFPLIDLFINRARCLEIITEAGLPIPRKSRCWQCPHQNDQEWLEIKTDPKQWAAALALEKEINAHDPEKAGLYLYGGRVPLEMADFKSAPGGSPCDGGHCFT